MTTRTPKPPPIIRCFGCKKDHQAVTQFSAFGKGCEPKRPAWRVEITGRKQCQCGACHEVFTTTRTFDSHSTIRAGKAYCKDPRTMFNKDHRRLLVLTQKGWAKNPELEGFNTFTRKDRA